MANYAITSVVSLMVWTLATPLLPLAWATDDVNSIRFGEPAVAYAAGSIQLSTPQDGFVNMITGDNQTTGDHMILGSRDVLYLRLKNPAMSRSEIFSRFTDEHTKYSILRLVNTWVIWSIDSRWFRWPTSTRTCPRFKSCGPTHRYRREIRS